MNNERDELSYCISAALGSVCGIYDTTEDEDREMAALLIDNGYRKPRTVTTAAELDALPVGSVVLDGWGTAYQKEADDDGDTYWSCFEGIIYHFKTFPRPRHSPARGHRMTADDELTWADHKRAIEQLMKEGDECETV